MKNKLTISILGTITCMINSPVLYALENVQREPVGDNSTSTSDSFDNMKLELQNLNLKFKGLNQVPEHLRFTIHDMYFSKLSDSDFTKLWNQISVKLNQRSGNFWSWLRSTYTCIATSSSLNCGQPYGFMCK